MFNMILCEVFDYDKQMPVTGSEGIYLDMGEITQEDDKIRRESNGRRYLRSPRKGINEQLDALRQEILRQSDDAIPPEHKEWYRLPAITMMETITE